MLFNSFEFLAFFALVFFIYWRFLTKNVQLQNLFLLIVSYVFYAWWDWRFLSLIIISSILDFYVGKAIFASNYQKKRKLMLVLSLSINLGFLGFFKYFNFFIDSLVNALTSLGIQSNPHSLRIILPVGISFYTFQTLSYTLDIYNKKLEPTKDAISFFAFVSFFPQLVAGPIERAKNLLPQFHKKRQFNYDSFVDGLKQILWGFFKKVVVADTCANSVDYIFSNYDSLQGDVLIIGAVFFAFQIYGDFSGYSDIAIGTAKLLGFNLMRNFNLPYFSRDIAEFWRRWHISLSSWFRDYLYIPLGGSHGSKMSRIRNIILTFTISGFWHGANWTFIFWGFLNGLYYIPLLLVNRQKKNINIIAENSILPSFKELLQMTITFILTLIAWVFFRSTSIQQAFEYLYYMFAGDSLKISMSYLLGLDIKYGILSGFIFIFILLCFEWFKRKQVHPLSFNNTNTVFRWTVYLALTFLVLSHFGGKQSFIYFQF